MSRRLEARERFVSAICKARMSAEVEREILEAAAEWAHESAMDAIADMSDGMMRAFGRPKETP